MTKSAQDLNIAPKFKDLVLDLRTAGTSSTGGELATGSPPLPMPVIHYVQVSFVEWVDPRMLV